MNKGFLVPTLLTESHWGHSIVMIILSSQQEGPERCMQCEKTSKLCGKEQQTPAQAKTFRRVFLADSGVSPSATYNHTLLTTLCKATWRGTLGVLIAFTQTTPEGFCSSNQGGYLALILYLFLQNCCHCFFHTVTKQDCRSHPLLSSSQQAQNNTSVRYPHASILASSSAQQELHTAPCFPRGRQWWTQHCPLTTGSPCPSSFFTAHRTRGKAK